MNAASDHDAVLARYKEGPALLEQALAGLQDADLDASPVQGGWTIRQITHHIADGDDLWKPGIKAALGNEEGEFTLEWYWSVPQQVWAERWNYAHRPLAPSIALFQATRDHVAQLMEQVTGAWTRTIGVRKPDGETEAISAGFIVGMQADHLEHHVAQILAIRGECGGA